MEHYQKVKSEEKWYSRPIFSVSCIEKAIDFYCGLLALQQSWKYEENGRTIVTQVTRGEFELILTENLDRVGLARVFIFLEPWEMGNLERMIEETKIAHERIHWGYPTIKISDPDGNELFFPLEDENSS